MTDEELTAAAKRGYEVVLRSIPVPNPSSDYSWESNPTAHCLWKKIAAAILQVPHGEPGVTVSSTEVPFDVAQAYLSSSAEPPPVVDDVKTGQ